METRSFRDKLLVLLPAIAVDVVDPKDVDAKDDAVLLLGRLRRASAVVLPALFVFVPPPSTVSLEVPVIFCEYEYEYEYENSSSIDAGDEVNCTALLSQTSKVDSTRLSVLVRFWYAGAVACLVGRGLIRRRGIYGIDMNED
jgi:hypothetical protein